MSGGSTLLIGGPNDGDVLTVADPTYPVYAIAPVDLSALLNVEGPFPTDAITTKKEIYFPETVSFFGLALRIHVHETLIGSPSVRERIATHLLSEKGKAVLAV